MSTERASIRSADPSQIRDAMLRISTVLNEHVRVLYDSMSRWAEANQATIRRLAEWNGTDSDRCRWCGRIHTLEELRGPDGTGSVPCGGASRSHVVTTNGDVFDLRPDNCWRCDAAESQTDVGLCTPCHRSLTA